MKQNSSTEKSKNRGFTLVELIVVIAILAILSAVGAVAYTGYIEYTKKGLDKQTVGEIERALELADYADPELISNGENATVYLSSNGLSAFVSGDPLKSVELENGLKDAFGDLKSVKLSYENWKGAFDAQSTKELMSNISNYISEHGDNSAMQKYLSGTETASFAGNIESYWNDVEQYIEMFTKADEEGGVTGKTLLSNVVNYSVDNSENLLKFFGEFSTLSSEQLTETEDTLHSGEPGTFNSASLAANYAFVSWVKQNYYNEMSADEKKAIDEMTEIKKVFDSYLIMEGRVDGKSGSDLPAGKTWKELRDEYQSSGQAKTDMLAFLGMMEAAKTLEKGGGKLQDDEFVPMVEKVVNTSAGVLNRSVSLEELAELAQGLSEAGGSSIISVTATKSGGLLSFYVTPADANPRKEGTGNSSDSTPGDSSASGTCERDHSPSSISMVDVHEKNVTTIDLCLIANGYSSCTIEAGDTADNQLEIVPYSITILDGSDAVSIEGTTITAKNGGTARIEVTYMIQELAGDFNFWPDETIVLLVNVHA